MGLYGHIAACNAHDLANFAPFRVAGKQVGWIRHELAERLQRWDRYFAVKGREVVMHDSLADVEARSKAMSEVGAALVVHKALPRNRSELCAVAPSCGAPALMRLDRAWLPSFGVISCGVHVNGYVATPDGSELWVGVRAKTRDVAPGKLDNLVAGGLPVGMSLMDNVVKEAAEEASVPEALARRAVPAGAVSYTMETEHGLRRDILFCYDLELPADFQPVNADGEIGGFVRWPARRALRVVEETDEFKFNVNLVLIDFAIRHGLIAPDRPDYLRLLRGLRTWG